MDSVREISPVANISQFFETMFGSQTGYVYAPIKELRIRDGEKQQRFKRKFFQWPDEKERLVEHCLSTTGDHEVYYSPCLWKAIPLQGEPITPELFKGTYWVWADFDYGLPSKEQMEGLSEPTIRVQSSDSKKEHWYWRLEFFNDNKDVLEAFTKRLTYKVDADPSGWDYTQVLRPPGTIHHKSGKKTRLIDKNSNSITIESLAALPELPVNTGLLSADVEITDIPVIEDVVFNYKWPEETGRLLRKKLSELNIRKGSDKPDRSSALMRLAYDTAEMGMNNAEIYAVLIHADRKWGKFTNTEDPKKAYIKMINRARAKYPISSGGEVEGELPIYDFKSFLETDIHVEWVIKGLLSKAGLLVISSPPGAGKTQVSLWVAMHIATGKSVFGWSVDKPLKLIFYSMEMGPADLKVFCEGLTKQFNPTPEEMELLKQNLYLIPLGYPILLDNPSNQAKILKNIDDHQPNGVMFDSLGVAIGDEISSDVVINKTFAFINKYIRTRRDCFVWFLHHNRKAQATNQKPKHLSDLLGSQYIASHATTVIGLWPLTSGPIEVNSLKTRIAEKFKSFKIERLVPLGFRVYGDDIIITEQEAISMMSGLTGDGTENDDSSTPNFGLE